MKRRKEVEIMLTVLADHGIYEYPELKTGIEQGLKEIRKQKFHEKRYAKAAIGARIVAEMADNQPG